MYVQFFHLGTHGRPIPMCGSDSVMLVDRRKADRTIEAEARTHALRLNAALRKGITGFALIRQSIIHDIPASTPITPL